MQSLPNLDLPKAQRDLSRAHLDEQVAALFPIRGLLADVNWQRITGLARFWEGDDMPTLDAAVRDALIGLHAMHRAMAQTLMSFNMLVMGVGKEVQIYVGIGAQPATPQLASVLSSLLMGTLPGIELPGTQSPLPVTPTALNAEPLKVLDADHYFQHIGYLTGIPSPRLNEESQEVMGESIDRLIRGMGNTKWAYVVRANPLPDKFAHQELQRLTALHTQASSLLKYNETENKSSTVQQVVAGQVRDVSSTTTFERMNRDAQLLTEMLDEQIERIERGRAEGVWETWAFFCAPDALTAARAGTLLRACVGGTQSRPEPVRIGVLSPSGTLQQTHLSTLLTSSELATLAALPKQEFNGYRMSEYAPFDVDLPPLPSDAIPIGKVVDGAQTTNNWFGVRLNDLAKHALVVGVTGSGKSTDIFNVLLRLRGRTPAIPFLVIEPAKTEYRRLLADANFKDLRVLTLGDERTAPFRLNPFEFDVDANDPRKRTHVQTHVDFLKAVFNAAFVLYAPMPYVLDMALHEVYTDKGWDFASGVNHRLPQPTGSQTSASERVFPVFPTLSDLWRKVGQVIDRMDYEDKIKGDVRAGLQARLDSLRLGAKGLMLDTPHSLDLGELLDQPTVLEMDRIGNDEEKAFLIGLLLTRISAFRRLQGNAPLRHITVIEEAHRLLKNVNTEVGTEEASNKAAAVEVFANMLSEIRAYGEGVIIAEQIPAKLAPDAIKNTNLKLMHRMLAADDREAVGATINLSEAQSRRAVALNPQLGEVIAFAEGNDRPYLLRVMQTAQPAATPPSDVAIQQRMTPHMNVALVEPAPDFQMLVNEPDAHLNLRLRSEARGLARNTELRSAVLQHLFGFMADPAALVLQLVPLLQPIRRARANQPASPFETQLAIGAVICVIAGLVGDVGDVYAAPYPALEGLRKTWAAALAQAIRGFSPGMTTQAHQQLIAALAPQGTAIAQAWQALTQTQFGPWMGCAPCKAKCAYRILGGVLALGPEVIADMQNAVNTTRSSAQAFWGEIAAICEAVASRVTKDATVKAHLKVCVAAHYAAMHHATSPGFQVRLVRNVANA